MVGGPRAAASSRPTGGLLVTNLLLWEAQEILYNHDMQHLPAGELRAYIAFFSENNLSRNAFMEDADRLFWAGAHRDREPGVILAEWAKVKQAEPAWYWVCDDAHYGDLYQVCAFAAPFRTPPMDGGIRSI